MPWIDEKMIEESKIQIGFQELLESEGWTLESHFKKVVFGANFINPISPLQSNFPIEFHIAEHFIFSPQKPEGVESPDIYFGLASYGYFEMFYGSIPVDIVPILDTEEIPTPENGIEIKDKTGYKLLGEWVTSKFPNYRRNSTIYTYMTEKIPDITDGEDVVMAWDEGILGDFKKASLDIEIKKTGFLKFSASPVFKIFVAKPECMQSPIVPINLRTPDLEVKNTNYNEGFLVSTNNLWSDSLLRLSGHLDENSLFFILQADNSGNFENNLVPSIPLYWGKIESLSETDKYSDVIITGSALESKESFIDYDSSDPFISPEDSSIMPILKNYGSLCGNGIDNIMIHRSKYGSRYQAGYLSWNAPPNSMPPERSKIISGPSGSSVLDYPRAYLDSLMNYKFNPSAYSNKIHSSRAYVVHPEEGVRGFLPNIILFPGMSMINSDKLKIRKANCPNKFDLYRYFSIGSISPFTKRPGTVYRPAGIGFYEKEME